MITSAFISNLRRQFNDKPVLHQDQITGDGSSTVYASKYAPIKENSAELSINIVIKTEVTDYTLDYDTGDIELVSATSSAISLIYQAVKFRDAEWLQAIIEGHRALGDGIFKSVIMDTSSMIISGGRQTIPCPTNTIKILKIFESTDLTVNGIYQPMRTNWKYDQRSNKIITSQKPTRNNYIAVSYLKKPVAPSSVSMALDLESDWINMIGHKAGAFYLRSQANKIAQQGNATVEEGHLNVQALRVMANDEDAQFEILRKRIKPLLPNLDIPYWDSAKGDVPA